MSWRKRITSAAAGQLRVVALGAALMLALSACSSSPRPGNDSSIGPGDPIPRSDADTAGATMSHVHGIGRNPGDGDVYVATHHGLWRVRGETEPELVGEYLHDFMGFSVVGADHFVASGHPNSAGELPPHLGLIESRDAGATWTSRSLLGEADFHALRTTGGKTYGWNSQGAELMVSDDRREWGTLAEGKMMLDVAADPTDGEILLASVATDHTTLQLQRSTDGGRSFKAVGKAPQLARFAWTGDGGLTGFAVDGAVWSSDDRGRSWRRVGTVGAMPDAVSGDEHELLAAADGKIIASSDGGEWKTLASYER